MQGQTLQPIPRDRLPAHVRRFKLDPPPAPHQDLRHLDDPTLRPISGGLGRLEAIPTIRGVVQVWGEVIVKNGDKEFRARNKIVGGALRHLVNQGLSSFVNINGINTTIQFFGTNDQTQSYIRVGTGVGSTTDGTTALVTPVATNPNSTSYSVDNPVAGTYRGRFLATWNAGALTAITVNEIGVFGRLATTLGSTANGNGANLTSLALFARLSGSDAEFTPFVVNTAVPLTIEYRVVFTFT